MEKYTDYRGTWLIGPEVGGEGVPSGHWHRLLDPKTKQPTGYLHLVAMRTGFDVADELGEAYADAVERGIVPEAEGYTNFAAYEKGRGDKALEKQGRFLVAVSVGGSEGWYVEAAWVDWSKQFIRLLATWKVLTGEEEAEAIARWARSVLEE